MAAEVALHPNVAPLEFLLGSWRGEGAGVYPTIPSFRYGEEVTFWHSGKPFLGYSQRTWALDDGRPLHVEAGYLRGLPEGRLELVLVHPTGLAEVATGSCSGGSPTGGRLELRCSPVVRTPSAKEVLEVARTIEVRGATLDYLVEMAAVGQPLQQHLTGRLTRVEDD